MAVSSFSVASPSMGSWMTPTTTWTLHSNTGDSPGGLYGHAMAVLSDDTVVLLGGEYDLDFETYGGTYQLEVSGSTAIWTLLSNTGDSPVVLIGHAMAVLSDGSVVVSTGNVDETHQLVVSGSTAAWKLLSTPGDTPGARVSPWQLSGMGLPWYLEGW